MNNLTSTSGVPIGTITANPFASPITSSTYDPASQNVYINTGTDWTQIGTMTTASTLHSNIVFKNPHCEQQYRYIWDQLHSNKYPELEDSECDTLIDYLKSSDKDALKLAFALLNNKRLPDNFELELMVWNSIDRYIQLIFENGITK